MPSSLDTCGERSPAAPGCRDDCGERSPVMLFLLLGCRGERSPVWLFLLNNFCSDRCPVSFFLLLGGSPKREMNRVFKILKQN